MGSAAQESLPRWESKSRWRAPSVLRAAVSVRVNWAEAAPQLFCQSSLAWPWIDHLCCLSCLQCTLSALPWAGRQPGMVCTARVCAQRPSGWYLALVLPQPTKSSHSKGSNVAFWCGVPGGALWSSSSEPEYLHGMLCACSGGRGMIKGDDDQGSYFSALSSSCCYINNANISAVTGIPVFPQLWIYSNRFSQL